MPADQFETAKEGRQGSVQCGCGIGFDEHEGLRRGGRILQDASLHYSRMIAVTHYRLGIVDLQMTPPMGTDGFWELARAIDLKIPNDAQVRAYLKNQIIRYQQPACDKLVDDQVNELLTLAATATDKPATLNVPSAADLQKARDDTANFIPALMAGGDAGKAMWLASCGLEYPDVGVRVMEPPAVEGDTVTLKVFRGATPEEIEAATDVQHDRQDRWPAGSQAS